MGKEYHGSYHMLFRVEDGRIAEAWEFLDTAYVFECLAARRGGLTRRIAGSIVEEAMVEVGDTAIGARVLHAEDPRILTGAVRYVDDVVLPDMLHAALERSTVPHGRLMLNRRLGRTGVARCHRGLHRDWPGSRSGPAGAGAGRR